MGELELGETTRGAVRSHHLVCAAPARFELRLLATELEQHGTRAGMSRLFRYDRERDSRSRGNFQRTNAADGRTRTLWGDR